MLILLYFYCVVPENINTPTTEGHWKFREGGGLKGQKTFIGKYEPKLEFPEGWEVQTKTKTCLGGVLDIFLNNT